MPMTISPIHGDIAADLNRRASALELGVTKEDARKSAYDFLRFVMLDETGHSLKGDHTTRLYVDAWRACIDGHRHFSFISPPGFGKTTLALGLLSNDIGHNPKLRTVVVTADVSIAINAVGLVRSIVLTDSYRSVFPKSRPDIARSSDARGWRMSSWYMQAAGQRLDPTMAAVAMEPKGEARRVDLGLFDDLVTEATCDGDVHKKLVERFRTTWQEGRCRPLGRMVYHQNIRRQGDLAHLLRVDPAFCSVWVGLNADCESLFCHVWNPPAGFPLKRFPEEYEAIREEPPDEAPRPDLRFRLPLPKREGWEPETLRQINTHARAQLWHLRGVRREDLMMPDWANRIRYDGMATEMAGVGRDLDGWPVMDDLHRHKYAVVSGLDFSSGKRPGCALWVNLVDRQGETYPLFLDQGRWTLGDINDLLGQLWERGVCIQRLNVEDNGVQEMLLRSMVKDGHSKPWRAALSGFTTGRNKWEPSIGLPGLNNEFANGIVHWPVMESKVVSPWATWWSQFELDMATLTRNIARDQCPDAIMAWWFQREAGRRFGQKNPEGSKPQTMKLGKDNERGSERERDSSRKILREL